MSRALRAAVATILLGLALAAGPAAAVPAVVEEAAEAEPPEGFAEAAPALAWPEPLSDPVRTRLFRAFTLPAPDLDARVGRTVREGLALGMRRLDAPARAVLLDPSAGTPLERAEAAVRLAPGLPAAHFALARARLDEGSLLAALGEVRDGVTAVPSHLEAWLWARATLLAAARTGALLAGVAFLLLAGAAALPRAVGDLARLPGELPGASRLAALLALLLLPAALGEGLLGVVLALGFLGAFYGASAQRIAAAAAAVLLWAGLFPLPERAHGAAAALAADPVAGAVDAVEQGLPSASDLLRVRAAADDDPQAAAAAAVRAKREGRLEEAGERFAALLPDAGPRLLNDAANVLLAQGRTDDAIALYERAAKDGASAVVLFNLSQAYGMDVQLDQQDLALAEAQAVDAEHVADLTGLFDGVPETAALDLGSGTGLLAVRLEGVAATGELSDGWRRRIAPGRLGAGERVAASAVVGAVLAGTLLGLALRRGGRAGDDDFYAGMAEVLRSGEDPDRRMGRLTAMRARRARLERAETILSLLVPGAAGVLGRRPLLGLLAVALAAAAVALFHHRGGAVPDPLAVGAGSALLVAGAAAAALAAVAVTVAALVLRERP